MTFDFLQRAVPTIVTCKIPFLRQITTTYMHVDFAKTNFTETAIQELKDERKTARFYVKDIRGKRILSDSLPLWFGRDVLEL